MILKKRTEEKLGEILLRHGVITKSQLDEALEVQKKDQRLLGEILIKSGYVKEREIAQALASQYGFPFMPLENYEINQTVVKLVPEEAARRLNIIPLDLIGDVLVVAMSDPLNDKAIQEVESATKKKIQPFISTMDAINKAIDKAYKAKGAE